MTFPSHQAQHRDRPPPRLVHQPVLAHLVHQPVLAHLVHQSVLEPHARRSVPEPHARLQVEHRPDPPVQPLRAGLLGHPVRPQARFPGPRQAAPRPACRDLPVRVLALEQGPASSP